jgi:hypothetical protein
MQRFVLEQALDTSPKASVTEWGGGVEAIVLSGPALDTPPIEGAAGLAELRDGTVAIVTTANALPVIAEGAGVAATGVGIVGQTLHAAPAHAIVHSVVPAVCVLFTQQRNAHGQPLHVDTFLVGPAEVAGVGMPLGPVASRLIAHSAEMGVRLGPTQRHTASRRASGGKTTRHHRYRRLPSLNGLVRRQKIEGPWLTGNAASKGGKGHPQQSPRRPPCGEPAHPLPSHCRGKHTLLELARPAIKENSPFLVQVACRHDRSGTIYP